MSYPRKRLLMLPGPTNVPERVMNAMLKPMINHRSGDFTTMLKNITEKTRYLFQTKENVVTVSASGTGGVEAVVWALVRKGDKVVVPVFGEFGQRLSEAVELAGAEVTRVTSDYGTVPRLEDIQQAISKTEGLKAVYLVHNETSTGCAVPYIEQVSRAAHEKGAFFVVDAVSSLGGYSIPVDRWNIDMCVTASQKCIAAPPGLALISLNNRVAEFLRKTPPTVRYFDLGRQLDFLAHGETPFTPAIPLYYALEEALTMLMEEGLEKRVERHAQHAGELYSLIEAMGLKAFARKECRSNTVIAALYPDGIDDGKFRKKMSDNHDIVIAGGFAHLKGKLFRIGSMGDVSHAHVHRTATAMVLTFAELGYKVDLKKIADMLAATTTTVTAAKAAG